MSKEKKIVCVRNHFNYDAGEEAKRPKCTHIIFSSPFHAGQFSVCHGIASKQTNNLGKIILIISTGVFFLLAVVLNERVRFNTSPSFNMIIL